MTTRQIIGWIVAVFGVVWGWMLTLPGVQHGDPSANMVLPILVALTVFVVLRLGAMLILKR